MAGERKNCCDYNLQVDPEACCVILVANGTLLQ